MSRSRKSNQLRKRIYSENYYAETGQVVYEEHREASKPRYKLLKVEEFIQFAKQKIQVEKWLKLQRNTKPKRDCSRKRILGQSIGERPQEINDRLTFGHWEIDSVVGKKTKGEPVVLTLTERLTRYQLVIKIQGKNEAAVKEMIERLSKSNPNFPKLFKSITADNGSEFVSLSEALKALSDIYFAHPYSSWERGTNEKHSGILRRFIPKGKSPKDYSSDQIKQITN